MNHHLTNMNAFSKQCGSSKGISRIIIRVARAGLALVFGFWLLLASNMGPTYLPQIMNGTLDSWIRITLLGSGLGIWVVTAVWLIWLILRYFYNLIRRQ